MLSFHHLSHLHKNKNVWKNPGYQYLNQLWAVLNKNEKQRKDVTTIIKYIKSKLSK